MQTFQHLFLNIPFNVMLALFKIGAGNPSLCRRQKAREPAPLLGRLVGCQDS